MVSTVGWIGEVLSLKVGWWSGRFLL